MTALAPRPPRRHSLSVTIIVYNEADRIEACLKSVAGWADEIIVLDSGSTDGTFEIVQRYADRAIQTDWPGFGPQRQRALDMARGDWVFALDADERATPELRDAIDRELAKENVPHTVYRMRWRPFTFGKELRFGRYATLQLRLFQREGAQYPLRQVHETVLYAPGTVGDLDGDLIHLSFRDFHHAASKHLDYAWLLAQDKLAQGRRASLWYASARFLFDFFVQYIVRLSFLDGGRGFIVSVLLGRYAFDKYAALWTLKATGTRPKADHDPSLRKRRPETKEKQEDQ